MACGGHTATQHYSRSSDQRLAGAHDRNVSSKEGGRGYDDVTIGQIRGPQTVRANTGPYIHNHCDAFTLSIAIQKIEHEVSIFDRDSMVSSALCYV